MLALDLGAWRGLPELSPESLDAVFGSPSQAEPSYLGRYPAHRSTYQLDRPSGGLHAYSRDERVVLVETLLPPPASALSALGPPTEAKPHEILVDGAYVYEWVYAPRGLVLSVAEPFDAPENRRIVRSRGVRPLASADEFGPEFYLAFEDQTSW